MSRNVVVSTLCLGLLLLASQGFALKTVHQDGVSGNFTTIAAALAAATPGEEVRVLDQGTYTEILTLDGANLTAVPVGATISGAGTLTLQGATTTTLKGFKVIPAGAVGWGVFLTGTGNKVIEDVEIVGTSGIDLGIYINKVQNITMTRTKIHNINYDAITVDHPDAYGLVMNISDCEFYSTGRMGLMLLDEMTLTMTNTKVHDVGAHGINLDVRTGPNTLINLINDEIYNFNIHGVIIGNVTDEGVVVNMDGCNIHHSANGHGVCMLEDSTINIRNSTIHDNMYEGIAMDGNKVDLIGFNMTLDNTSVINNKRHGIGLFRTPKIQILNGCQISGNGTFGFVLGGSSATGGSVKVDQARFAGNPVNNFSVFANISKPVKVELTRSKFEDGTANKASNVYVGNAAADSSFVNNLVEQGAIGLEIDNAELKVYHNTIVNDAGTTGTGINIINCGAKPVDIANNIIDRLVVGMASYQGTAPTALTVDYNLVHGSLKNFDAVIQPLVGTHNVLGSAAPFVAASATLGAGNYRLGAPEPACGVGVDKGVTVDLTGASRSNPTGSKPDLGAYESSYVPVELSTFAAE